MKVVTSLPLKQIFRINPFSIQKTEPVLVSIAPSSPMRPVEIRRNLRHLRETRHYTIT
jgi:hypothetical protein